MSAVQANVVMPNPYLDDSASMEFDREALYGEFSYGPAPMSGKRQKLDIKAFFRKVFKKRIA